MISMSCKAHISGSLSNNYLSPPPICGHTFLDNFIRSIRRTIIRKNIFELTLIILSESAINSILDVLFSIVGKEDV